MHATFVANPSLSNNPITNICSITRTTNPIRVHNVEERSKNYLPYKIMNGYTVESAHSLVKRVEKVFDKECLTWFIGTI